MYHTQNSGVGLWRMIHPAKVINELGLAEVKTLPFYFRTHGYPDLRAYIKDCEDKGKTPSEEEFNKKLARVPKEPTNQDLDKLYNWADIVVVMRRDTRQHCAVMGAMKEAGKPVVFETDDFVQYVPPYNPGAKHYRPGSPETDIWPSVPFKIANAVIVTTPGLKDLYKQLSSNIYVVPNAIEPDYWMKYPDPEPHPDEIRIGWAGANAHWGDLRRLKDVIGPILDKYPQVKFHFIGQLPDWWYDYRKQGRIINHRFKNLANYPKFLHSLRYDIGVAPLVDNLFNRGKSNIRWIEYSVNGAATIASPIKAYTDDAQGIVKHDKNIYFAKETNDWIEGLSKLIEDETYRKKIAKQAYNDVMTYYNLKTGVAQHYVDVLQKIHDDHYR